MIALGIETSCDETSAAAVDDRGRILSNVVHSQQVHGQFGGVVPELASRDHLKKIASVAEQAASEAGGLAAVDLVAATGSPGLMGALLVGHSFASALAASLGKPLVTVNHVEAHVWAAFLQDPGLEPPLVALVVSGGHTSLFHMDSGYRLSLMGRTLDDAAGEAFDKVAKMMGLGYPGGPVIERRAAASAGKPPRFPRALLDEGSLDFSFSGLKTAVLNHLLSLGDAYLSRLGPDGIDGVCRGFQDAVFDVLADKAARAAELSRCRALAVVGGVAANGELRRRFGEMAAREGIKLVVPTPDLCTDNAAMVAWNGWRRHIGGVSGPNENTVKSRAQWPQYRRA